MDREQDHINQLRAEWSGRPPPLPSVTVPLRPLLELTSLTGAAAGGLSASGAVLLALGLEEVGLELLEQGREMERRLGGVLEQLGGGCG